MRKKQFAAKIFSLLTIISTMRMGEAKSQMNPAVVWDSIKSNTFPVVEPAFQNEFGVPYKQPLSDYGWEDGLQISPDGLNLYALYLPMDLLSWQNYFATHLTLPIY